MRTSRCGRGALTLLYDFCSSAQKSLLRRKTGAGGFILLYDEGTVISDFTPDNIAIQLFNATATTLNCISQICCFHVALISCLAINEERYRKMEQRRDVLACLLVLIQPHLIGDHGDELAVGGLAAQVVDGVAEIRVWLNRITIRKRGPKRPSLFIFRILGCAGISQW